MTEVASVTIRTAIDVVMLDSSFVIISPRTPCLCLLLFSPFLFLSFIQFCLLLPVVCPCLLWLMLLLMTMHLVSLTGCGVLVSGDDQGEVWVYDVFKQAELAESAKIKGPFKPNQVVNGLPYDVLIFAGNDCATRVDSKWMT